MSKKKKDLIISQEPRLPMNGNYLKAIMAMEMRGQIKSGTIATIHVTHDEWCEVFYGGECNCSPDIVVEKMEDY